MCREKGKGMRAGREENMKRDRTADNVRERKSREELAGSALPKIRKGRRPDTLPLLN